jgi:hypothetical protein
MASDLDDGADQERRKDLAREMDPHDDRSDGWFVPVLMTSVTILAMGICWVAPW